jgi:hypothetical protein
VVSSEPPESALVLLGEANKDIDEGGSIVRCRAGQVKVLVDNLVEESIELPKYLLTAGDETSEMVHDTTQDAGEVVLGGEAALYTHGLIEQIMEVLLVCKLL